MHESFFGRRRQRLPQLCGAPSSALRTVGNPKRDATAASALACMRAVDALMQEEQFLTACGKGGIPPSRRQARKWLQGRGLAFTMREEMKES